MVEYTPGDGKWQNVHNKKWKKDKLDLMGEKANFIIQNSLKSKNITVYECNEHKGIYWQNATEKTKKLTKHYVDNREILEKGIGSPKNIVIINDKTFGAFGAYDRATDTMYLNEKIIDKEIIQEISDSEYYASNSLNDVIRHELHHKEHHDAARRFYNANKTRYNNIEEAKHDLEQELYSYLNRVTNSEPMYLAETVSEYAKFEFENRNINEVLAEASVKIDNDNLNDKTLKVKIEELMNNVKCTNGNSRST